MVTLSKDSCILENQRTKLTLSVNRVEKPEKAYYVINLRKIKLRT